MARKQEREKGTVRRIDPEGGRGGRIRTGGPLRPRQVRYQAALRPDSCDRISTARPPHGWHWVPALPYELGTTIGATLIPVGRAAREALLSRVRTARVRRKPDATYHTI